MINILPELIYKERQQLSDFEIDNEWSIDRCFYQMLERMRGFADNANADYEQEYCSMFNTAYYLTTVILNSEDPEQYFDEYLKVGSGERVVFTQGTLFSSDIRSTCVMQMVNWLIKGIDRVRPCDRRLQERLSEWLAPKMALVKLFVKDFPTPHILYDRNDYPLRPLTPDVLKGIDWGKLPLTAKSFTNEFNDIEDTLFKVGKNALVKLLLTDSMLQYIKQKVLDSEKFYEESFDAKLFITNIKLRQLELYPELKSLVEPEEDEPESCPHPLIINYVMNLKGLLKIDVEEYRKLWDDLLAIKEVEAELYKTGRQGFKKFNSYLIAGIIYEIKSKVFKPDINDSDLARELDKEKGYDSTIRKRLGKPYQSEGMDAARKFIEKWKEEKFGKK